eukprot:8113569-Ditylum_brightwellii.AAC.1
MVQQKGESWGFTGDSYVCPLKPMQWLQRAQAFPYTQKGEGFSTQHIPPKSRTQWQLPMGVNCQAVA